MTDKRIAARLEALEGEIEWSRDLTDLGLRDTQASVSDLRADLAKLKSDLANYQVQQEGLSRRLEALAQGLGEIVRGMTSLESKMGAPRRVIRDQDGLITKIEVEG
jgi:chromosome segregation ATPase